MVGLVRDPEGKNVFSSSKNGEVQTDNSIPLRNLSFDNNKSLRKWKEANSDEPQDQKNLVRTQSTAPLEMRNGHTNNQKTESAGKW